MRKQGTIRLTKKYVVLRRMFNVHVTSEYGSGQHSYLSTFLLQGKDTRSHSPFTCVVFVSALGPSATISTRHASYVHEPNFSEHDFRNKIEQILSFNWADREEEGVELWEKTSSKVDSRKTITSQVQEALGRGEWRHYWYRCTSRGGRTNYTLQACQSSYVTKILCKVYFMTVGSVIVLSRAGEMKLQYLIECACNLNPYLFIKWEVAHIYLTRALQYCWCQPRVFTVMPHFYLSFHSVLSAILVLISTYKHTKRYVLVVVLNECGCRMIFENSLNITELHPLLWTVNPKKRFL